SRARGQAGPRGAWPIVTPSVTAEPTAWPRMAASSRTVWATAGESLRRILVWLLGTFALTLRFGLRASTGSSAARPWSISPPRASGPEAVTRGHDEPHRAGQAVEDRHAGGGDLVALDVDIRVLISGHPRSQAQPGSDRQQQPPPAEHLPDLLTAFRTGHTD